MKSKLISSLEMGIIDVNSEYLGVNRRLLMENAGKELANLIWEVYQSENKTNIIILAGKGGNGGDGMVAARHLARYTNIDLFLIGSYKDISKKSTLENFKILQHMPDRIKIIELKLPNDVKKIKFSASSIIVDSILGTGIKGSIREPLVTILKTVNKWQKKGAIIISADTPTGVDPSTGNQSNIFLTPEWTGVFHRQKTGLNRENAGIIKVLPIGVPPEAEEIIGPGNLLALKNRSQWSKKGDNGKILVIGGNETYSGAPSLAALGAIQSKADLVSLLAPEAISCPIRSFSPELIVRSYPAPHLISEVIKDELIQENDVILLGPGLGMHEETREAVFKILKLVKDQEKPIVLDADALKFIEIKKLDSQTILTPHAGEFKILTGTSLPANENNFKKRIEIIQNTASQFPNITWIIKGHWDIVANDSDLKINRTGTPLMTRGGTGDILAGLVAGFIPQTKSLFHAACIAAYTNGRAGELAVKNFSLPHLLEKIPEAIEEGLNFIKSD